MAAYVDSEQIRFVLRFPDDPVDAVATWVQSHVSGHKVVLFNLSGGAGAFLVNFGLIIGASVSAQPPPGRRPTVDVWLDRVS